jgi:hypothetical protein
MDSFAKLICKIKTDIILDPKSLVISSMVLSLTLTAFITAFVIVVSWLLLKKSRKEKYIAELSAPEQQNDADYDASLKSSPPRKPQTNKEKLEAIAARQALRQAKTLADNKARKSIVSLEAPAASDAVPLDPNNTSPHASPDQTGHETTSKIANQSQLISTDTICVRTKPSSEPDKFSCDASTLDEVNFVGNLAADRSARRNIAIETGKRDPILDLTAINQSFVKGNSLNVTSDLASEAHIVRLQTTEKKKQERKENALRKRQERDKSRNSRIENSSFGCRIIIINIVIINYYYYSERAGCHPEQSQDIEDIFMVQFIFLRTPSQFLTQLCFIVWYREAETCSCSFQLPFEVTKVRTYWAKGRKFKYTSDSD